MAESTYTVRRAADWDGPWIPAGETIEEATGAALWLAVDDHEGPFVVTIRNAFNHSAAKYEVHPSFRRVGFMFPVADWSDDE